MTKLVFHVGLAKAASTFLQSYFFSHPTIGYDPLRPQRKLFAGIHPLDFRCDDARTYVSQRVSDSKKDVFVFSAERLSGNPHSGNYDACDIAYRLVQLDPNIEILVCIREQYSQIASCYKQYVRIGGTKTLYNYVCPPDDRRLPLFNFEFLKYSKYIKFLQTQFKKVHVLLLEEIALDANAALSSMCQDIGIDFVSPPPSLDRNIGIPDRSIEETRYKNLEYKHSNTFRDLSGMPGVTAGTICEAYFFENQGRNDFLYDRSIKEEVQRIFRGKFHADNKLLSTILKKPLRKYGYE